MRKKSFKAESKRLLDLMINSIYTNKDIFLREIISNASDAVDKLHYLSLTDSALRDKNPEFAITVALDKTARTVTVSDNGIGMTAEELEENLGTIAKSGSLKFKEQIKADEQDGENTAEIIGQFGVGFYSAFMVADKVTVITKKYDSDTAFKWVSSGCDGYTIEECEKDSFGTEIVMHIKEDTADEKYSEYLEQFKVSSLIRQYSDYIRYPIFMDMERTENVAKEGEEPKYEKVTKRETLNSMVPIWQRSKLEVTDEECNEYYKEKFMDFSDPVATIRVSAEGLVSYKAMLFIPSSVPYGYFTKDFEKGLQLYSNGVLIMDRCEDLLPDHFRFVKGVVDSPDLSLNISREILQHDRQLKTIAANIEKKIKAELAKLLNNEPQKYAAFWRNFGVQVKYGAVSDFGMHKDAVKDLLVFHSSETGELTTLKDYVARMKEGQQFIYYACGDSVQSIAALPQTELCRDKGYEMLYMTEDVDEFVVKSLINFDEKEFKSVADDDAGLKSEEEKKETEEKREKYKDLCDFVKETLGDDIAECVISDKLKSHPVFISARGQITLEMEKYFSMMPGEEQKPKAEKVLELNPDHKVFKALEEAFQSDKEKAAKIVKILGTGARLIAGLQVEDAVGYCDLICDLIVE